MIIIKSFILIRNSYLSEYLKVRSHDPEEAIRHDVIVSIVTAAKKDILLVNDHLLNFVRERTLDKRVGESQRVLFCVCYFIFETISLCSPGHPGTLCID